MRPKTKLQKSVAGCIHLLPPLTEHQKQLAIKHGLPHIAKLNSKNEYVCLDCGHRWNAERANKCRCPHCNTLLEVDTDRKRNYDMRDYVMVVSKCREYQVLRMFQIKSKLKRGEVAEYILLEAFQRWIAPNGEAVIVGRRRHFMTWYCDVWDWSSDMEIRPEHYAHSVMPGYVLGRMNIIPELKRNGFCGKFYDLPPYTLMQGLLSKPMLETLIKAGQISLLQYFTNSDYRMKELWPMVKIAIRNKYMVKDASMWIDLILALEECGKDTRNAKFICPENLQLAHDHWVKKREEKQRKERIEKERKRYLEDLKQREVDEKNYVSAKGKFFGILITDGEIDIKVLDSVKAFFDEAAYMSHCVAANKYYNKENSLILSATLNGVPLETIEIDLQSLQVLQCRGKHNQTTDYHERILRLMKDNMCKIEKLIA